MAKSKLNRKPERTCVKKGRHYSQKEAQSGRRRRLATKGRGLPSVRRDVRQVVVAPGGRHSEKPQEVHHRIEELYGPQRRIELFARRQAPGWDAVGDGIDGQDIRKVLVGA